MKNKKELVRSLEESVSKGWYCSAVKLAKEIGRSEQEIEEYEARQKAYSKMRQMLRKGYSWKDIGCKLRGEVRNYNSWLRDDAECIAYAELAIKAYKRSAEEGCDSDSKKEGWCGHCWEQATNLDEKVERLKKRMQLDHHKKIEEWAEAAKIAEELEWWDEAKEQYIKADDLTGAKRAVENWRAKTMTYMPWIISPCWAEADEIRRMQEAAKDVELLRKAKRK